MPSVGHRELANPQSPTALTEAEVCWVRSRRRALVPGIGDRKFCR
jgi:hypothetical protein